MPSTFADILALLLDRPGDRILHADARMRIERVARRLPPLGWGGFECTLGTVRTCVDLHQGLAVPQDMERLLAAPLTREAGPADRLAWEGIARFLSSWRAEEGGIGDLVGEAGVEFDLAGDAWPAPALFWTLSRPAEDRMLGKVLRRTLETVLGTPLTRGRANALERIANACGEACTIPAAGVMLSRASAPIRLNVWGLQGSDVPRFLGDCGWEDPSDTGLGDVLERIAGCTEAVTLALTLGDTLLTPVGLECAPLRSGMDRPDWEGTLRAWRSAGFLDTDEEEGLLAWEGRVGAASSNVPWPGALIAEALSEAEGRRGLFHCTLSHLKVVYGGDGGLPVKGYLAFLHAWEPGAT